MAPDKDNKKHIKDLPEEVGNKAARRIKARREENRSVWFGIGMFGMVGWTVAMTTLIGVALGVWLDRSFESSYSWTLTFLLLGLIFGCMNAWYWLKKEGLLNDKNNDSNKND